MSRLEIQPSDDPNQPDRVTPTDTTVPARHRVRRLVLTGVAGAVLVGGGGAYAFASGDGGATTTPSAPASGAPAAPGNGSAPAAPADAPKPGPHIDGEVTAVSGSTITVKDPDGFTRTIKTSGDTKYDDGVSSPVATGTRIHATGTVDSDGTSLDATQIGTMPEPGKDGPPAPPAADGKAPAAPGQGSGSTDAPAAPSGAPAAPSGAPAAPSGAPSAPSSSGSKSSGSTSTPSGSKSSGSTSSPSASPTGS